MFERYKIVIASLIFLLVVIVGLLIGVIVLGIVRKGKHIESKQLTVVSCNRLLRNRLSTGSVQEFITGIQ